MRYAIISDIHSNIQALEKAFSVLEDENVDQIVCLGDIVGYNANPIECIRAVQSHPKIIHVVQGNHDVDSIVFEHMHISQVMSLSSDAYAGLKHTSSLLSNEDRVCLASLPKDKLIDNNEFPFWISHYSPNHCTMYGYILNQGDAEDSMDVLKKYKIEAKVFFFGHTHIPAFIREEGKKKETLFDMGKHLEGDIYVLDPDRYYLINPGAIGQPRNGGITSYAVLDTKEGTVSIRGFEYDFKVSRKAVLDAGYSLSIANRLDPTYDERKVKKKAKRAKKERCKKQQKARDSQNKKE